MQWKLPAIPAANITRYSVTGRLPDRSPTRHRQAVACRRYQRISQITQTKKAVWAIAPPIKAIVW
jgi:hypothetical protein